MSKLDNNLIINDVVLAIVINTSATLLSGAALGFSSWYPMTCAAFGTNVLLQLLFPIHGAAEKAAGGIGGKAKLLVQVFVENLIFVTCISLTMALVQTSGVNLMPVWFSTYIPLVLIGYVTSIVLVWKDGGFRS